MSKKEMKKLRKAAIRKMIDEGCPKNLAKLMPKSKADYSNSDSTDLYSWFEWLNTEQGFDFWYFVGLAHYRSAYKVLERYGLKPWKKKQRLVRT